MASTPAISRKRRDSTSLDVVQSSALGVTQSCHCEQHLRVGVGDYMRRQTPSRGSTRILTSGTAARQRAATVSSNGQIRTSMS
jgi:hypothetical protein